MFYGETKVVRVRLIFHAFCLFVFLSFFSFCLFVFCLFVRVQFHAVLVPTSTKPTGDQEKTFRAKQTQERGKGYK